MAVLLLGATAPPLAAQSDNFNDGNDTSPVGWHHYTPPLYSAATYTLPNDDSGGKAYKITALGYATDPFGLMQPRAGSFPLTPTYTTRFSMGTDLLAWSTAGRPSVGMLWYLHDVGLGSSDGYVGSFSPNYRNIYNSIASNWPV